jgi:ABC-type bacteriocin/lantibiotic exporter with double-glycine peptidase domain
VRRELALASSVQEIPVADVEPLPFTQGLAVRNVSFKYGNDGRDILNNVNLHIPVGSMTGIIGKTGAGKTTFVDILLGLLEPVAGDIVIDDIPVTAGNRRAWQKNLSYVSQHIYLCDDTIAANIAFGVPAEKIDRDKLCEAAKMASLSAFIEGELSQGYETMVGENGIRLSGGQRQRIGLARALYLNRPVLILDEATSALDPETEADVMQSIHALEKKKTILIISHKPELLSRCDTILTVQDGAVLNSSDHISRGAKSHV